MNPNLKFMFDDAKEHADAQAVSGSPEHLEKFAEKFADFVIRECATISQDCDSTWTGQGQASGDTFKQHFGIT
jgi:hypothetical protein